MYKLVRHMLLAFTVCVATPLFAAVEYDIINVFPFDKLNSHITTACDLSETGYVVGVITDIDHSNLEQLFIFHPVKGRKILSRHSKKKNKHLITQKHVQPLQINNKGVVCVLEHRRNLDDDDYLRSSWGVFTYRFSKKRSSDIIKEKSPHNVPDQVRGISDNGQVIIVYDQEEYPWETPQRKVYDVATKRALRNIPEDVANINSLGDLIGNHWFYSAKQKKMHELGSLDPFGRWMVYAQILSDAGYVAGCGYDVQEDIKGFLWDQESGLVMIDTLGGEDIDIASVNNLGQVVGCSKTENLTSHAFFFDKTLGTVDLKTSENAKSRANDINDFTQVVGEYDDPADAVKTAFIWDPKNGMRALHDLIPENSGWEKITTAKKINNMGYIIGDGIYQGQEQGFLLIPKKP